MHNLRHFYYQNKEKIWKVVIFISFLLGIIYFINGRITKDSSKGTEVYNDEIYSDTENKIYISNQSAISGETVTQEQVEKINNTISKFLQYCKEGNAEEAYNMISADCKEEKYKSIEQFKEKYLKSKFSKESVYEIKNWIYNTYKITISKDILATGNVKDNEKFVEYITIIKENSQEKLNLGDYVEKRNIDKEINQNDIKITVMSKKVYMDYEIYDFKIKNLSDKTIKIDSLENTGTMYLQDLSKNKYNAYAHEIFEDDLEIKSQDEVSLSIKYANKYSSSTNIKQIVFENVILDYIKYKKAENKETFEDTCEVKISL